MYIRCGPWRKIAEIASSNYLLQERFKKKHLGCFHDVLPFNVFDVNNIEFRKNDAPHTAWFLHRIILKYLYPLELSDLSDKCYLFDFFIKSTWDILFMKWNERLFIMRNRLVFLLKDEMRNDRTFHFCISQ